MSPQPPVIEAPMPARKPDTRDRVDLRAEPAWIARIAAQADRLGISVSAYIRLATTERLEKDEASAPVARRPTARDK